MLFIAEAMGLPRAECELIRMSSPMHDVGKIGIADAILLKPGRLDDEERAIMETHASIGANLLLISTAVEKVYLNFNTPDQKAIDVMTMAEAKQYMEEGHFAKGSMLPKIQACIQFIENGGKQALITDPPNIPRALNGETGTWIVK